MVSASTTVAGLALPDWMMRVQSLICSAGDPAASLAHQPRSAGDWASAGPAITAANVRPASRRNACAMRKLPPGHPRARSQHVPQAVSTRPYLVLLATLTARFDRGGGIRTVHFFAAALTSPTCFG